MAFRSRLGSDALGGRVSDGSAIIERMMRSTAAMLVLSAGSPARVCSFMANNCSIVSPSKDQCSSISAISGVRAAQFGSAVGLFERTKLELDSPATPVNETGLLDGQFLVIENVGHQVDLAATIVEAEQTQHQRRLLLPHRLIGPAVDDVAPLPNHAQAFQQPNIAADADQEAMAVIEDRPP